MNINNALMKDLRPKTSWQAKLPGQKQHDKDVLNVGLKKKKQQIIPNDVWNVADGIIN